MPKIIDEARASILVTTRRLLEQQGYAGVSLRSIAAECGIAVGTIYNYFKNKDTLIAHLLLEDWAAALQQMDAAAAGAHTPAAGVQEIYTAVARFAGKYSELFSQYAHAGGSAGVVAGRHQLLRDQLVERMSAMLHRLRPGSDAAMLPLLAETVLAAALHPELDSAQLAAITARIYP